jgi:serine/threonine protein kinase
MEFENLIGKEIEQYRVEALVGKGNMAAVFRAQDLNLARPVALKVIYPIYVQNNAWRDHFLQKARAAARLTHPSIVPIYKSGIEDDYVYIVSAFAEGMSLARIIARLEGANQRIKMDETLQIVAHVADALGVAHQEGLLHLDVKPENIFVQRSQRPLRAGELPLKIQLTDFGLAAVPESPTKTLPHQVGAYHYLPPEHWLGRKIDGRADIYALGALLYYLLCGQYPFPIQSASEAAMRHTLEEPTPIHAVSPGIPPALSADVVRALRKKASERFAHAEQMADALREHAAQLQPSDLFFRAAGAPVVSLVSQWETLRSGTPLPALEPPWQGVALPPVDTPPAPLQSNNDDPIQPEPEYAERNLPATGLSILALPGRGNGTDAFLEPLPELPAVVEPPIVAPAPRRAPAKQPAQAVDENHTPEILLFDDEVGSVCTRSCIRCRRSWATKLSLPGRGAAHAGSV